MKKYSTDLVWVTTRQFLHLLQLTLNFAESCTRFEEDIEKISHVPYSSAVGSLMYAMMCAKPNLSYAVSVVSHYMHNPGRDHWETVK